MPKIRETAPHRLTHGGLPPAGAECQAPGSSCARGRLARAPDLGGASRAKLRSLVRTGERGVWGASSLLLVFVASGALLAPASCGDDASASSSSPPDAGQDANVIPAQCEVDPETKGDCVDDKYAIFVAPESAGGAAGNAGTKAQPLASIDDAVRLGIRPFIFVCENSDGYDAFTINRAVSVYGGFTCTNGWSASASAAHAAKVNSKDASPALTVSKIVSPITVGYLAFTSQDAVGAGTSSVAGWVTESMGGVTLKNLVFSAGSGAEGAPPPPPRAYTGDQMQAPNGIDAVDGGAAVANLCTPPLGESIGGQGGQASQSSAADGGPGQPSLPRDALGDTGAGGDCHISGCGGPAISGAFGAGGDFGLGAATPGKLTADGWAPAAGENGGNGQTAQGGGGGAGYDQPAGGGGAGGCGGFGGQGGQAGGSSVALLIFSSKVSITGCTLTAHDGKNGGQGQKGETAQLGGAGGRGAPRGALHGCPGAPGGIGGSGGGGGGGAGGWSIGLAFNGPNPIFNGVSVADTKVLDGVTVGNKGSGGPGGAPGDKADTWSQGGKSGPVEQTTGLSGDAVAVKLLP